MATVTVTPDSFNLVLFDAAAIAKLTEGLAERVGLPADIEVRVEVDETTPLGRAQVASLDPVVLTVESGALEDPKRPRQLSETGAADVLGRLLLRVVDRRTPAFGDPPADGELSLAHSAAWDAYAVGRLVRLGHRHYDNRQRRLYHFRIRHGFTETADAAFARLWEADALTWTEIAAISDEAGSGQVVGADRRQ